MDSKEKFTLKSDIYDKYRPKYSERFIDNLKENYSISSSTKIADIGAGTGILTQQLLKLECEIFAIEPNDEMRKVAEKKLKDEKKCQIINGSAESTKLEDNSIDLIVVAQAFHWFDNHNFRNEFQRISKSKKAVLVWNTKRNKQPYLVELEKVNKKYCKDFKGFSGGIDLERISDFFDNKYEKKIYENNLKMNKENFINGILTGSYTPNKKDKYYNEYIHEIEIIFNKYCEKNELVILNDTIAYFN